MLAEQTKTPNLRVECIEQTIVDWSPLSYPVGPVGYAVAPAIVLEQLRLGQDVIVECVHPWDAVTTRPDEPWPEGRWSSIRRRPRRRSPSSKSPQPSVR